MPATTIPDTAAYLYLGLGTILFSVVVFLGSLLLRYQELRKELNALSQIESR